MSTFFDAVFLAACLIPSFSSGMRSNFCATVPCNAQRQLLTQLKGTNCPQEHGAFVYHLRCYTHHVLDSFLMSTGRFLNNQPAAMAYSGW